MQDVAAGDVVEVPVVLKARESVLEQRSSLITFELRELTADGHRVTEPAKFLGPTP